MSYMHREICEAQADAILQILRDECGYNPFERDGFVRSIVTEGKSAQSICDEYRFMGALGFGGKFRNNGNNNNTPYVDCYREDETSARTDMIERANKRLAALFAEAP